MSVATLCARRESGSNYQRSWVIRVCGLIYSKRTAFQKNHPAFLEKNGELILDLENPSVQDEETLKEDLQNKLLPVNLVTLYLKSLAEGGCKVMASTSGAANDEEIWFIWTLSS